LNGLRQKLHGLFQTEYAEHLQQIRSLLTLIENTSPPEARAELNEIYRHLHTLKGAARVVDLKPVERLAHLLETLFSQVREGSRRLDRTVTGVIRQSLDLSEDFMAALVENRKAHLDAGLAAVERLLETPPSVLEFPSSTAALAQSAPREQMPGPRATSMVRVNSETLNRFDRSISELLSEVQAQSKVAEALSEIERQILFLEGTPEGARGQALQRLARQSGKTRRLQQRSAWAIRVACEQLQQHLLAARTVPVETLFEGFHKMIRDFAREEQKEVEFRITGTDVLADRMVMQALKDPVMHLLRNAVSHGLETREERLAKGKRPAGSLTVRVKSGNQRFVIEVEDDGRGIDLGKIGETAVKKGLISREQLANQTPEQVARFIFEPGFSTAPAVTELSGRGMGLSVVHEAVLRLRGRVTLGKHPLAGGASEGTSFILSAPLSIEAHRILLVSCEEQLFGVPMEGIAGLFRVNASQIESAQGYILVTLDEKKYPLFPLADLLKIAQEPLRERSIWLVMLLQAGGHRVALLVDAFVAERAELIHDIGITSGISKKLAGAMLQRDGTVALVLNPAGLVEACGRFHATRAPARTARPTTQLRVLVADDSNTTRQLEKTVLEAAGYSVRAAADGLEALEMIGRERPHLVISDIEMPRMSGLQLLAAIRDGKDTRDIPFIFVSSLAKPEERAKGLALGANAYIAKGEFDEQRLLQTVGQVL
jgi:two-component system, chemotaxis family, sensor kinase CheA